MDISVNFGKYKGKMISEVKNTDEFYCNWLISQGRGKNLNINRCIDYLKNITTKLYIYVLKLECNNYYIGRTSNVERRFQEHLTVRGSVCTTAYKPLEIIHVFEMLNDEDEDNFTRLFMKKYGIDCVRGGSFSSIELRREVIIGLINRMEIYPINDVDGIAACQRFIKLCPFWRNVHKPLNYERMKDDLEQSYNKHNLLI
jgi:hypothetical protein